MVRAVVFVRMFVGMKERECMCVRRTPRPTCMHV